MKEKELTDKAKEFCRIYVSNGYIGAAAYREAYGQEDLKKSAISAWQLLQDPRVQEEVEVQEGTFRVLGYKEGLTKEAMVKTLAMMARATKVDSKGNETPDWLIRHTAIMSYAKLTGDANDKKKVEDKKEDEEVKPTVQDLSKLKGKELIDARKKILEEMTIG